MSTPSEALSALRAVDQRNQGRAATPETGEITAERLAAVEAHAVSVRVWHPNLIPGLLQTTRYATAAIATARPAFPAADVQRYAHMRAARVDQFMTRLQNPAVGEAVFVMGGQAISRPLTHAAAHRAQLRQLLRLAELPNVRVHVLPEDRSTSARPGHASLYALAPDGNGTRHGARVGYTETPLGGWYSTRPADVARLRMTFDETVNQALDANDTRSLIQEALTA
ncbi:DUF5753 domain-containing protein [Actinacidiphila acidipaludis]|uniref:DUF5753 domain-containing protein n=1 Tax=Actinacidiphila acidipaludis TaxID=2873382 RepID=A0ABS7QCM2_9ACTN|nr:DUF5753 domain-containing protein [Streptomyces acidipaludis]MBY8879737.1 DUF5753 domain-containing protein [Streptomyces acidipaludis]